jgi:transcriptional regulator with XRE-family HTH domain
MEKTAISPDEVMSALRQYLDATGESQRSAAAKMGVNRHSLCRWLSDKQSPQKENLVMVASFLRRSGYL